MCEAFIGPPPDASCVCHWDGNGENNRIDNLRWGDNLSNARDRIRHGNQTRGEAHHTSKLNSQIILDIRSRYHQGERQAALAEEFGIHQVTVSEIVLRKIWRHLP
jgi:hypothetical protein